MDGVKEQTKGDFRRKLREVDCTRKQTEPYTSFQNAAEGAIREIKKGSGRKMMEKQSPKKLWNHSIELESFIQSHTAHDIWQLRGQVPQTKMGEQTADISQFFELGWYDWCLYYDSNVSYPEDRMVLGRGLGPSLDVGPSICGKILKNNGNTKHLSTYRALTKDDGLRPELIEQMRQFDSDIRDVLGPAVKAEDFEDEFDDFKTPINQPYEDNETQTFDIKDRDEYENLDSYIGAEVLLPHSLDGTMKTAKTRGKKRDADGCLKGTSHNNIMFDTRAYIVEFPDGTEAKYTTNVIAENM